MTDRVRRTGLADVLFTLLCGGAAVGTETLSTASARRTPVIVFPALTAGQVFDGANANDFFFPDGDITRKTSPTIRSPSGRPCAASASRSRTTPDVDHFFLPSDAGVLGRILHNLKRPKSVCR